MDGNRVKTPADPYSSNIEDVYVLQGEEVLYRKDAGSFKFAAVISRSNISSKSCFAFFF